MEKVPKFKTAEEEAEFWETHSPLDFPSEFEEVKEPIVDRRGRKKGIYIRIDPEAIELARHVGAELGVGYQTLFRMWIMEGLSRHLTQALREPQAATVDPGLLELLACLPLDERRSLLELLACLPPAERRRLLERLARLPPAERRRSLLMLKGMWEAERWTSPSSSVPSHSE